MARYCTSCGREIPSGSAFCSECGAIAPPESSASRSPQPAGAEAVSTGYFFWMTLVYGLPVIGWAVCLIMSFASQSGTKKHHARAYLIWALIGIVLIAAVCLVLSYYGTSLIELADWFFDVSQMAR